MGNPPAHRRLVPRVPKPVRETPEDLEVTSQRVIEIEVQSDLELPHGLVDDPDGSLESLEMTAITPGFAPAGDDDFDEMTAQRAPAPSDEVFDEFGEDDDDAHETSTHLPRSRESLAHLLSERAVPEIHPAGNARRNFDPRLDTNGFSDSEPTSLKAPTSPDAEDRPMTHISPAEIGLLAAMAEGHEASRMVYMKWLEKRGEVVRAEFLRIDAALAQMGPQDPRYPAMRQRLLELAPRIGVDWRARVSRSLIEGCTTTTGRCPAYWRALPTEDDTARTCTVCGDSVFYCVTIDLARSRVAAGQRVAVDMTVDRAYGDLDPRATCTRCRSQIPLHTRYCPHCGSAQGQ